MDKEFNLKLKNCQVLPMSVLEPNDGQIPGLPANPREINQEKFELLKKNVKEHPQLLLSRGLLVFPYRDTGHYVIIGGNQRFRAMSEVGYKTAPCEILPAETTVEELKAYTILDNNGFGKWDWDMLANDWDTDELENWGLDLWADDDNGEPEGIKDGGGSDEEDDFDPDEAEIETRSRPGDIWQCGNHRLMCGDSTDAEAVASLMAGNKADMVFTDPPYGVAIGDKNKFLNSVHAGGRCTKNIYNDAINHEELYPILVKAMTNCRENCKDDASYYVTSPQGGELGMMMMMMKEAGLMVRHILIWVKNSATFSLGRLDYDYQHEPIFYTWTKKHHNYRNGQYRTTIWAYDKPRKCDLHPTMKPVKLVENCLLDSTHEGDIVLDMFGGSGTTLIAAEQLGRKAFLMELDPHYCDVIIARWEKLTGKEAVRVL